MALCCVIARNVMKAAISRAEEFCHRFGLRVPILMAPMAGACPPALAIAIGKAGGLGACGVVSMTPSEITAWAQAVRAGTDAPFQFNHWIPGPKLVRDAEAEAATRAFLGQWGPPVAADVGDTPLPVFADQCQAMLDARPAVISSIMGVYDQDFVAEMKRRGIAWFATATTAAEARAAAEAGADVIVAQGAEAGGHRGSFRAEDADRALVGLMALVPAIVDAVDLPVVATGGIADARGTAAAFMLGASAVQIGTGFLRCPEAGLNPVWADMLSRTAPEQTRLTNTITGRFARCVENDYVRAAASSSAPPPAPYPVQRFLTGNLRLAAQANADASRMMAWSGQSARLARAEPAASVVADIWSATRKLLE